MNFVTCKPCKSRGLRVRAAKTLAGQGICDDCLAGIKQGGQRLELIAGRLRPRYSAAESVALVRPFLALTDWHCLGCMRPVAGGARNRMCGPCTAAIAEIREAKWRLKKYRETGQVTYAQAAASIIRQLGLTPEDFARF